MWENQEMSYVLKFFREIFVLFLSLMGCRKQTHENDRACAFQGG